MFRLGPKVVKRSIPQKRYFSTDIEKSFVKNNIVEFSEAERYTNGLKKFMKRTYTTSLVGVAETLSSGPLLMSNPLIYMGMGLATTIAKGKRTIITDEDGRHDD